MRSTEIVNAFWDEVWNAHDPDAVDKFVADDVVIEAGGQEIAGKDNVKNWVKQFLDHVDDLRVETIETFQDRRHTVTVCTTASTTCHHSSGHRRRPRPELAARLPTRPPATAPGRRELQRVRRTDAPRRADRP